MNSKNAHILLILNQTNHILESVRQALMLSKNTSCNDSKTSQILIKRCIDSLQSNLKKIHHEINKEGNHA